MLLDVLESLREIIFRYVMVSTSLVSDINIGDKDIFILTTRKFFRGDEIFLINNDTKKGEKHTIERIIDRNHIVLKDQSSLFISMANGRVDKAAGSQYVKRVYLGDPNNIPDFPSITIEGKRESEEWWTIKSTKITWSCTISVYLEDANYEESYKNMIKLTSSIEKALWTNRWPVFGSLSEKEITSDINVNDQIIKVSDTSQLQPGYRVMIEDIDFTQENEIETVIDNTTLKLSARSIYDFSTLLNAKLFVPERWIMWSYTPSTDSGYVHKGTLMKASQINWQVIEEVVRPDAFPGPVKL